MPERPQIEPQVENRVAVQGRVIDAPQAVLLSRPALAALTVLAIAAIVQWVPGLERARLFNRPSSPPARPAEPVTAPVMEVGEAKLQTESRSRSELAQPEQVEMPRQARGPIAGPQEDDFELPEIDAKEPPVPLLDPTGSALDGFYRALVRTAGEQSGAITRVVHFGDSIVTSDYVSGTLRRELQKQFGDAGHGFMLMANAWPAYFHNDVYRFASKGWRVSRIVGPLTKDGMYGLGGVSFRAPPGVRARFGTAKKGEHGRAVSRFEVVYLEQPGGGRLKINVDGELHDVIDTDSFEKQVAYEEIRVPDGEHMLEVVTRPKGMTRAFGVVMEREVPGVVLDAIGIQGARIRFLDKQDDEHWANQLKWRDPDLLIYQFGANESGDGFAYPMDDYHRTMKDVIVQGQRAVPDAGCLIIGAMDRARKREERFVSMRIIPMIVKEQRAVAREVGCAFFNTYEAMGGRGSMANWVKRGLGQADLTHPTGVGSRVIGNWIYRALVTGYKEWLAEQTDNRPR